MFVVTAVLRGEECNAALFCNVCCLWWSGVRSFAFQSVLCGVLMSDVFKEEKAVQTQRGAKLL